MVLNLLSGLVGGVWLAFLGEWRLLFIGIILLFTSHFYLGILMLPGLIFLPIIAKLGEKKNPLMYLFGFLSQFYTNLLIIVTCAFAFVICTQFYDGGSKLGIIPYLLWSWGMALGPWASMQSREPDNEYSAITLLSASIFYFLYLISIFIHPVVVLVILTLFLIVQLIVIPIFNMIMANQADKFEQEYR